MTRFVFRWLLRLAGLGVVVAVAGYFGRDLLLREWIAYRLRSVTGLETQLGGLHSGPGFGVVTLENLRLVNSTNFGGGLLLAAPELHLELDRDRLARRELRFRLARLHLAELSIVRNASGQTNLVDLLDRIRTRATAIDAMTVSPPGFEFGGIETLDLTLGTARFVQLGPVPVSRDLRVGMTNEILREVRSTDDLAPLLFRLLIRELGAGLGFGIGSGTGTFPAPPPVPGPRP